MSTETRNSFDVKSHFTQQKQVSVLEPGKPFVIADVGGSRFEAYDSLAKVHALYATLSKDPKLAEFAFVLNWPKLKDAEKRELYSKHACHELHFFLSRKDPQFFASVVQPYLANKKDKTFLDHWLLGRDVSRYLEPWEHGRLNTVCMSASWTGRSSAAKSGELATVTAHDGDDLVELLGHPDRGRATATVAGRHGPLDREHLAHGRREGRVDRRELLVGQVGELLALVLADLDALAGDLVGDPERDVLANQPFCDVGGEREALGRELGQPGTVEAERGHQARERRQQHRCAILCLVGGICATSKCGRGGRGHAFPAQTPSGQVACWHGAATPTNIAHMWDSNRRADATPDAADQPTCPDARGPAAGSPR